MKPNPVKHATSSRLQQRKPQNNTQTILQRLRPQVPKCLKHDTLTVHNNTEASHISATRADTAPTPHSSDQKGVGTMAHTHRQANGHAVNKDSPLHTHNGLTKIRICDGPCLFPFNALSVASLNVRELLTRPRLRHRCWFLKPKVP